MDKGIEFPATPPTAAIGEDGIAIFNTPVFEEPPLRGSRIEGRYQSILELLLESPGKWAKIAVMNDPAKAGALAQSIRNRKLKMPEGKWHATARTVEGKGVVYAMYIGPLDDDLR